MKKFILSLLSATKGTISSKRFCGIIGYLSILGLLFYCVARDCGAPDLADTVLIVSASLLGVDSVMTAFNKSKGE